MAQNNSHMRPPTFQDFLEEKFLNARPMTTKDNFEDHFDSWVSDMQYDDWTQLGDEYGAYIVQQMQNYYADMAE